MIEVHTIGYPMLRHHRWEIGDKVILTVKIDWWGTQPSENLYPGALGVVVELGKFIQRSTVRVKFDGVDEPVLVWATDFLPQEGNPVRVERKPPQPEGALVP